MSIKLLQVSVLKCHLEGVCMNKLMHIKHVSPGADHQCLHWRVGVVPFYSNRLHEGGTVLPKHVAV